MKILFRMISESNPNAKHVKIEFLAKPIFWVWADWSSGEEKMYR